MPAGALTPIVRWQVSAAAGAPVPGAKLLTYLSGTSIPQPVYQDAALLVPHPNPVVADTHGTFPAIYLAAVSHRVRVTTFDNVTVFPEQDDVYDFAQVQFAQPTGAALIGFIQVGAGAVPRTALDKMREIFSAKDFNAKGTGLVNDYPALTTAIAAALAAGGGSVFLGTGRYLLESQLFVPDGVTVYGLNRFSTHLVRGAGIPADTPTVRVQGGWAGLQGVTVDNAGRVGDGVLVFGGNYGLVADMRVVNCLGKCMELSSAGSNQFRNLFLQATGVDGQCFVMEEAVPVTTALELAGVHCVSDSPTKPTVMFSGVINTRWFGGAINCDNGPGLFIQQSSGLHFYGLYVEHSAEGDSTFPVEIANSASDVSFDGGTFNANKSTGPVVMIRSTAQRVRFAGRALIGREGIGAAGPVATELVRIEGSALEASVHSLEDVSFRNSIPHCAVRATGGQPMRLTLARLADRGADYGTLDVLARDSFITQTRMPINLALGSYHNTLIGCDGAITDPSGSASRFMCGIGPLITAGHGSPEGVVVAEIGSLYQNEDYDGVTGGALWVKQADGGLATGWVAK